MRMLRLTVNILIDSCFAFIGYESGSHLMFPKDSYV